MKRLWIVWVVSVLSAGLLGAASYRLDHTLKIPDAFFFTPAAGSAQRVAFGYMRKIRPTPEEIEKERRKIRAIIRNGIIREYGSWGNYEKEMQKAGQAVAEDAKSSASARLRRLMPPELIEKSVPALLKGALLWVMAHPESQTRPFGNVGETGVVVVERNGRVRKIPIGIDQPVVSITFSPDGTKLALLSDMSSEDEKGDLHIAGRISVIDTHTYRVVQEWVLSGAADEIRFTPDGRYLAFLTQEPADRSRKTLHLIDTRTWRITPGVMPFSSRDTAGSHFGKAFRRAHFRFCCGGKMVALAVRGGIECRSVPHGRMHFRIKGGAGYFTTAKKHPWLLDDMGRIWNCTDKTKQMEIPGHKKPLTHYLQAAFIDGDKAVVGELELGEMERVSLVTGRVEKVKGKGRNRGGLFILSHDEKTLATFRTLPRSGFIRFGTLRRKRVGLHLFDTKRLRYEGTLEPPPQETFIDAAAMEGAIVVGGVKALYLYRKSSR